MKKTEADNPVCSLLLSNSQCLTSLNIITNLKHHKSVAFGYWLFQSLRGKSVHGEPAPTENVVNAGNIQQKCSINCTPPRHGSAAIHLFPYVSRHTRSWPRKCKYPVATAAEHFPIGGPTCSSASTPRDGAPTSSRDRQRGMTRRTHPHQPRNRRQS